MPDLKPTILGLYEASIALGRLVLELMGHALKLEVRKRRRMGGRREKEGD